MVVSVYRLDIYTYTYIKYIFLSFYGVFVLAHNARHDQLQTRLITKLLNVPILNYFNL